MFHTNSHTTNSHTESEMTTNKILFMQEEQLNTLNRERCYMKHVLVMPVSIFMYAYLDVIVGLGVTMALMLTITAVVAIMFIGAVIKQKRRDLKICTNS